MIDASLKLSSIYSANFVRNESHRSSSSSSSHSCILFSSMWVLNSYFFFDFSAFLVCSTLSVDFSLIRIETRLCLANSDSEVICRLAVNVDLQKWMRSRRIRGLNWKSSNDRCENRFVEFFSLELQVVDSEIDWLISRWNEFKKSMQKSILLNYLFSKTIACFEAKFEIAKVCFFVIILSFSDLCVY
jgi:hypothetical protein